ncbi:acyl-CoA dehydrogenase family protein [Bosea sp. (in: a-proteobacteria)]|uniref:acyl-CoA dehydrogenase family protein n=1 Tax=Bosea sp. (in: a-proteobacteria) TaxID=1871050 RepID=UPI00262FF9D5|nr:acyl-CoA dehydrogenase family protein [Bosea sp. (in: a-proteobacteria)]MCO5089470.1 acyl-CoA/acyl-ACP dehydrogenase [Bosea sp. (in: a-proteobacteria)]
MDFELTDEQRIAQDATRRMVSQEIEPLIAGYDPDQPLPKDATRQLIQILAKQGLTTARLPEEAGGSALSALTVGLILEQLPPVAQWALGAQEVTIARIYRGSTPEQRARILPDLIAGNKITCTGTTEPDAGSDPRSIRTTAVEDGDHYIVNGTKMWVTNASVCDVMMVTTSVGRDENGLSRMMRIVIDKEESPFTTRKIPTLGLKSGHLGEATFVDCRVPKRNVLGETGDASRVLTETWIANRPFMGLYAVHLAQKAYDAALAFAGERVQFGRKIAGFQLVQELLANIATAITSSRLLCYYALSCIDRGERSNQISAMAKRYSLAACQRAISEAMEVHGAMGISTELGLERLYRDARMLPIPDGTNQILTLIEGREITGIPAYRA